MKRLTMWYDGNHAICENEECSLSRCPFADPVCEQTQSIIDRLAAYEDTGLEPEGIEQLKGEVFGLRLDKRELERYRALGPIDRLRELKQADDEGRCVMLDGKSRDKELIRKLVRLFYWLEDCVKKKDFSPFRIVAGAPENNYPFISTFQRIENEYELEIHLAGKDEEAQDLLRRSHG